MKILDFETAFKYPFNRPKGMLNILWLFLPIIGWFPLGGYGVRIVREFSKGQFKNLPKFNFEKDFKLGFIIFIKSLPFVLVYGLFLILLSIINPFLEFFRIFFELFLIPILAVNFMNKETVSSFFEFKILKHVFQNFGDYVIVLLKSILLGITFLIMIVVLVGLPAGAFTKNIFIADFYRRRVKNGKKN